MGGLKENHAGHAGAGVGTKQLIVDGRIGSHAGEGEVGSWEGDVKLQAGNVSKVAYSNVYTDLFSYPNGASCAQTNAEVIGILATIPIRAAIGNTRFTRATTIDAGLVAVLDTIVTSRHRYTGGTGAATVDAGFIAVLDAVVTGRVDSTTITGVVYGAGVAYRILPVAECIKGA